MWCSGRCCGRYGGGRGEVKTGAVKAPVSTGSSQFRTKPVRVVCICRYMLGGAGDVGGDGGFDGAGGVGGDGGVGSGGGGCWRW